VAVSAGIVADAHRTAVAAGIHVPAVR
jgi:hypothetical protein